MKTEQLLFDMGFHPTTARAFRDFDVEAVRGELHRQDLLGWQPQEECDRRIGRLVLRWRRARSEAVREREVGGSYREVPVNDSVPRQEETLQPVIDDTELDEPFDPWTERARRLRPTWTDEQQGALARALRHAPNDGATVAMALLMLGVLLAVLRKSMVFVVHNIHLCGYACKS